MPDQTVQLGGETSPKSGVRILADAVTDAGANVSNGFSGIWKQIANMTAVGVIALLVLRQQQSASDQAHEDRKMFQDSIGELRRSQESRWQATEQSHTRAMDKFGSVVERNSQQIEKAVGSLERATSALERKE